MPSNSKNDSSKNNESSKSTGTTYSVNTNGNTTFNININSEGTSSSNPENEPISEFYMSWICWRLLCSKKCSECLPWQRNNSSKL